MESLNVNIRKHRKTGKTYAVTGRHRDGRCLCYCLNDDHHFECEKEFLLKKTVSIHWLESDGFKNILQRRYGDKLIHCGSFRWVDMID